jgi:hypothetical protein
MLNVSGMVVIPSEPMLKTTETNKGNYLSFQVVSTDEKRKAHRYQASMWVPSEEVDRWKNKIEPGNVFLINHARWSMRDNPDFKFPIPQLNIDRQHFKKLVTPFWMETKDG